MNGRYEPIDSSLCGIFDELLQAIVMQQVVVNIEHNRNLRLATNFSHRLQHPRRRRPRFQTALGGQLIDNSIGQRIAERNTDFEHINAEFVERFGQVSCRF